MLEKPIKIKSYPRKSPQKKPKKSNHIQENQKKNKKKPKKVKSYARKSKHIKKYQFYFRKNHFFQFRAMKLSLKPGCRAYFFVQFGPVYSLIGSIWTDFIKNPKIINYIKNDIYIYFHIFCVDAERRRDTGISPALIRQNPTVQHYLQASI